MTTWNIKRGTLERQVADTASLVRLAQEGRLKPSDLVFHPDRKQWLSAREVPELSDIFVGTGPELSAEGSSPPQLVSVADAATAAGSPVSGVKATADLASSVNEGPALFAPAEGKRTMKSSTGVVVVFLLVVCVALLAWPLIKPAAHTQAPTQWEYSIVAIPDAQFEADMNKLGAAGWELVFARRASDGSTYQPSFSYEVILKRPKVSGTSGAAP